MTQVMHFDLLLRHGTVVTPSGRLTADVGLIDGRIAAIGDISSSSACETFEANHQEDLGSGSASAAFGGVTGFFELPNTNPSTESAERLAWKVRRARETSWVDFLAAKRTITNDWSKSRCGWTPFDGFEATGWPIVRGRVVMRDGALVGSSAGQPMAFDP